MLQIISVNNYECFFNLFLLFHLQTLSLTDNWQLTLIWYNKTTWLILVLYSRKAGFQAPYSTIINTAILCGRCDTVISRHWNSSRLLPLHWCFSARLFCIKMSSFLPLVFIQFANMAFSERNILQNELQHSLLTLNFTHVDHEAKGYALMVIMKMPK